VKQAAITLVRRPEPRIMGCLSLLQVAQRRRQLLAGGASEQRWAEPNGKVVPGLSLASYLSWMHWQCHLKKVSASSSQSLEKGLFQVKLLHGILEVRYSHICQITIQSTVW